MADGRSDFIGERLTASGRAESAPTSCRGQDSCGSRRCRSTARRGLSSACVDPVPIGDEAIRSCREALRGPSGHRRDRPVPARSRTTCSIRGARGESAADRPDRWRRRSRGNPGRPGDLRRGADGLRGALHRVPPDQRKLCGHGRRSGTRLGGRRTGERGRPRRTDRWGATGMPAALFRLRGGVRGDRPGTGHRRGGRGGGPGDGSVARSQLPLPDRRAVQPVPGRASRTGGPAVWVSRSAWWRTAGPA